MLAELLPMLTADAHQNELNIMFEDFLEAHILISELIKFFAASMGRSARTLKLILLRNEIQNIIRPLNECLQAVFTETLGGKTFKYHRDVILYVCDISEGKHMSGMKRGETMYPCIQFLGLNYIICELKAEAL